SPSAIRRLLSDRIGLNLPRHLMSRIVESTLGNPLFALELGRSILERGVPEGGDEIALPDSVEDMREVRVGDLAAPVRRALLAIALSADLRRSELEEIAGATAVDEAIDCDVLHVYGDRVRPSHPLLAAAAKKRSRPRERRDLHRAIASV